MKASVIMPVYNSESYLVSAINSVLAQTFKDFEFIIINDGSTDKSGDIIDSFDDTRIRHLKLKKHYGAIAAANLGLAEVNSPLIIRMDPDCVSLPDRFSQQVSFMNSHPDIGVCGSGVRFIDSTKKISLFPFDHQTIVSRMLFENPVANTSAIMRTSFMHEKGFRYRDLFPGMAEFDLWFRLKNVTNFANLPAVLVEIPAKNNGNELEMGYHEIASSFFVEKLIAFGLQPSLKELKVHIDLTDLNSVTKFSKPARYRSWLDKLETTNNIVFAFPIDSFSYEIEARWKDLFKAVEKFSLSKSVKWLKIEGKSALFILKYRVRRLISAFK